MSTSIILLDRNFSANDVDRMVFESSFLAIGGVGNKEHYIVQQVFYTEQIQK